MNIETKDWIMVLATMLGPILAVQAQKWIEGARAQRGRKLQVFTQLMATRAARLSPEHVQAINMIDLVFYGAFTFGMHRRTRKEQAILDAWKEYHDNLCGGVDLSEIQQQAHFAQRNELFLNLLYAISQDVGFTFDRVQLKRGAYTPVAHEEIEADQNALRKVLLKALSGDSPLSMNVLQMPSNPELAEEYRRNIDRIANALEANSNAMGKTPPCHPV
ncbi:DUF6680 family protein [Limnohabitans sp. DM1]|uniref:DUF6680 family protein n=1 Tax=Limnohabitans sp. DM1 TaxID=1597955 RepID=UPI000AB8561C|nr:DUF6680 family protein [Limnohabitans sp. DM1]